MNFIIESLNERGQPQLEGRGDNSPAVVEVPLIAKRTLRAKHKLANEIPNGSHEILSIRGGN